MTPEQIRKKAEQLYPHFIVIDGVVQLHPTREENIDGYIAAATKYAGEIEAKDKEIERLKKDNERRTKLMERMYKQWCDSDGRNWKKFKTQNNI